MRKFSILPSIFFIFKSDFYYASDAYYKILSAGGEGIEPPPDLLERPVLPLN